MNWAEKRVRDNSFVDFWVAAPDVVVVIADVVVVIAVVVVVQGVDKQNTNQPII